MSLLTKLCLPLSKETIAGLPGRTSGYYDNHDTGGPGFHAYVRLNLSFHELRHLLFKNPKFRFEFDYSFSTEITATITESTSRPELVGHFATREGSTSGHITAHCRLIPSQKCFQLACGGQGLPLTAAVVCYQINDISIDPLDSLAAFVGTFDVNYTATDCELVTKNQTIVVPPTYGYLNVGKKDGVPTGALFLKMLVEANLPDPDRRYLPGAVNPTAPYVTGYFYNFYDGIPFGGMAPFDLFTGSKESYDGDGVILNDDISGSSSLDGIPLSGTGKNYSFDGSSLDTVDAGDFKWMATGSDDLTVTGVAVSR